MCYTIFIKSRKEMILLFMPRKLTPCTECADRVLGCHSTCEKYAEFKKQNDAVNKKRTETKCHYTIAREQRNSKWYHF